MRAREGGLSEYLYIENKNMSLDIVVLYVTVSGIHSSLAPDRSALAIPGLSYDRLRHKALISLSRPHEGALFCFYCI